MSEIVAKQLVEHLERSGFVVMKKPPAVGRGARARIPSLTDAAFDISNLYSILFRYCFDDLLHGLREIWGGRDKYETTLGH